MTIPPASFWILGFLPGLREIVLVALVVVALYGRSETVRRGLPRVLQPWTSRPARARPAHPARGWLADRWFVVVASAAAAAVAAWVVTSMILAQGPPKR